MMPGLPNFRDDHGKIEAEVGTHSVPNGILLYADVTLP